MQNAMTCHMQKQFSSISETVQSSQNSSNSCTVRSLQYRFNTKLMSIRQIRHPCPSSRMRSAHTSSKIVDAHTAPARSEGCEVRSDTPRSCRCPSLVYRPDCRSGCRCRPHQHDQHHCRRLCFSTDESQSRHHMDCSPAWVHGVEILLYLPTVIMDTDSRVNMPNLLFSIILYPIIMSRIFMSRIFHS